MSNEAIVGCFVSALAGAFLLFVVLLVFGWEVAVAIWLVSLLVTCFLFADIYQQRPK